MSFSNINTTAITFTDNGEVWVSTQEGILKSANQGKDWKKINNFIDADILYFDRLSRQMLVINNAQWGSIEGAKAEYTRFYEDGSFIATHVFDNNFIYDVFRATEKNLYMATQAGLWRSQDNGVSFKKATVPAPTYHFNKADNYLFASTFSGIYRASLTDTSWVKKGVSGLTIYSLASNNSRLFATTSSLNLEFYYSDDNAISWQENAILNQGIKSISALNDLVCVGAYYGT